MGAYDDQIPPRGIGRPEEIADLCVYLASSRASFMHGTDVSCDGGMWALNKVFSYNP
jgi:NAD(P)-dependent dehydrogenase (short-subunit alcohol dehydrogenase family)